MRTEEHQREMTKAAIEVSVNVDRLPASKRDFAKSLCAQFERKGTLSEKQEFWLLKLNQMIFDPQPEPEATDVGDFSGVIALFETAARHLKFPKIRLQVPFGDDDQHAMQVCLSRAGERSRYPGQINVTDGGSYGDNVWFGRVDKDGRFSEADADRVNRALNYLYGNVDEPGIRARVRDLLKRLAEAPAETAAEYGRLTGNCCFCNTGLSDERSTAVGYGKTCASHYDLPWGVRH